MDRDRLIVTEHRRSRRALLRDLLAVPLAGALAACGSASGSASATTAATGGGTGSATATGSAVPTATASPSATAGGLTTTASAAASSTTSASSAATASPATASASSAATSAPTAVTSPATSAASSAATSAATATGEVAAKIVAAANAFLGTLDASARAAVQFPWTDTAQKQRWSNLPQGLFQRAGLMWGNLTAAQQRAWLAVMAATLSPEGYDRVTKEWAADDALAAAQASGGGGGPRLQFGKRYYFVALIGAPSTTSPWQWQWGGHHVTVNATVVGGNLALTPSFIGVQPATYTDASGQTIRPLGDIEDGAFALVNALDASQQAKAVLGSAPIDLVLGPGQDGKTLQPEGLPASALSPSQRAMLLALIGHYVNLADAHHAAARLADVQSRLAETYFAWYGPTTKGSAAYFRVAGPTIVIEYAPQGGGANGLGLGGAVSTQHIHGIYRDPTNDYGAALTKA